MREPVAAHGGEKNSQLYTEWGDYAGYKCGLRLTLRSNAAQHPVAFILCRDQGLGRTAATRDQLLNYSLPLSESRFMLFHYQRSRRQTARLIALNMLEI